MAVIKIGSKYRIFKINIASLLLKLAFKTYPELERVYQQQVIKQFAERQRNAYTEAAELWDK